MNYSNGKWVQTYILIWSGQFISMLSSYAVQFAITIWLSLEHQSAEVLAFAGMAAILPQAIIGPFAGVLIDRWNRKTVFNRIGFVPGFVRIRDEYPFEIRQWQS